MLDDFKYLQKAIDLAESAWAVKNHPCGSLIVDESGNEISACSNVVFSTPDITAHAEMMCLRKTSDLLIDKQNAHKYTMYCSIEPCSGCAFFIARAKNINRLVYAAHDRYRRGLGMLKESAQFSELFVHLEVVTEPDILLRNAAIKPMCDYFIAKGKPEDAKFFDPAFIDEETVV